MLFLYFYVCNVCIVYCFLFVDECDDIEGYWKMWDSSGVCDFFVIVLNIFGYFVDVIEGIDFFVFRVVRVILFFFIDVFSFFLFDINL